MPSCPRCGREILEPDARCANCERETAVPPASDQTFVSDETFVLSPSDETFAVTPSDETFALPPPDADETLAQSPPDADEPFVLAPPRDTFAPAASGEPPPDTAPEVKDPAADRAHVPAPVTGPTATSRPGWSRALTFGIAAAGVGGALATLMLLRSQPAPRQATGRPVEIQAASMVPAARKELPAESTGWSSENVGRWVGNHGRSVAFELPALNTVAVWMTRVRPLLVVRCLDRSTDVFVYTGSAAAIEAQDEDHTVRLAFDDEAAVTERWPDAAGHDALFAPDGEVLARRLARASRLRFAFTPHNAAPVEAEFDLRGLDELVDPLARACRWK